MKVDLVEIWLTTMGASHSDSQSTRISYKKDFERFSEFTQITPEEILEEYSQNDIIVGNEIIRKKDQVIQKHTQAIILFMAKLKKEGYLPASIQNAVHAVRSFYKYNNLQLGNIEVGKQRVILHNRDITKQEIEEIIRVAQPREKAFYSLLVQSGLRPQTLCLLKIGDVEGLTDETTPIPTLIRVSEEQTKGQYGSYWSFAGKESVDYLKEYLKRRNQPLNPAEYLFTHDKENTAPINTDIVSHIFRRTITKLKKEGVIDFKNKESAKTNRNEIRLYNLRKYFRNKAGSGYDFVNFWMGHLTQIGVDAHYFSTSGTKENIENNRQIYANTALKNLRIESKTPNQMEQTITDLQNQIKSMNAQLEKITNRSTEDPEDMEEGDIAEPTKEELLEIQNTVDSDLEAEEPLQEESTLKDENEYLKTRIEELESSHDRLESELAEIKNMLKSLLKK